MLSSRKMSVGSFRSIFRMKDRFQCRPLSRIRNCQVKEIESVFLPEADYENPFPVLWNETLGIDNPPIHLISKLVLQCVVDNAECVPLVMIDQILDIF